MSDTFKELAILCIAELPPTERIILSLYYIEDLNLDEITRVLNLDIDEVSWLLGKAVSSVFSCQQLVHKGVLKMH